MSGCVVVGVGNAYRGDDGAGLVVAELRRGRCRTGSRSCRASRSRAA